MTDEDLVRLLRSALPPTADHAPSRDLWPLVATRVHARAASSRVDLGIAVFVAVVLLLFPKAAWLIAYHL